MVCYVQQPKTSCPREERALQLVHTTNIKVEHARKGRLTSFHQLSFVFLPHKQPAGPNTFLILDSKGEQHACPATNLMLNSSLTHVFEVDITQLHCRMSDKA